MDLSNVISLGSRAFNECRALTGNVNLSGLTTIPSYAFVYTHVRVTALNPALTSIGAWAFVWADLSDVELPDSLTTIGSYACYGADSSRSTRDSRLRDLNRQRVRSAAPMSGSSHWLWHHGA